MLTLPDGRSFYFAPADDVRTPLLALLASAQMAIRVAMYAYTLADVTDLLIAKHQAGVDVRMVLDRSQASPAAPAFRQTMLDEAAHGGTNEAAQLGRLESAGVQLVIGNSAKGGLIHSKYVIVDGARLFWGSYNLTLAAAYQCNQVCIETNERVAAAFLADWHDNYARLGGGA